MVFIYIKKISCTSFPSSVNDLLCVLKYMLVMCCHVVSLTLLNSILNWMTFSLCKNFALFYQGISILLGRIRYYARYIADPSICYDVAIIRLNLSPQRLIVDAQYLWTNVIFFFWTFVKFVESVKFLWTRFHCLGYIGNAL